MIGRYGVLQKLHGEVGRERQMCRRDKVRKILAGKGSTRAGGCARLKGFGLVVISISLSADLVVAEIVNSSGALIWISGAMRKLSMPVA